MTKHKKTVWVKRRHRAYLAFLRPIMRMHFKLRYNYKAVKSGLENGAYLIIKGKATAK